MNGPAHRPERRRRHVAATLALACAVAAHAFPLSPAAAGSGPGVAPAVAPGLVRAGALTIERPWSRATPGGAKVAGGYLRIRNGGMEPDRLVGGSFALAAGFEVHETRMEGDVMRMRPVTDGLVIPPGGSVELKPGGHHAMFVDLKEGLREGQSIRGTLVFEKAGTVEVTYEVRGLGTTRSGDAPAGHHHH